MPLVRIEDLGCGTRLGVWRMDEALEDLPRPCGRDFSDIRSERRQREILTTYCLLEAMTGRDDLEISHAKSGKPIIDGLEVSLSHTKGWAAMIVSGDRAVGVDIEYFSDRVNKVAGRFIRPDEQSDKLSYRLINWSAKETVYKLLHDEHLMYFDMRLGKLSDDNSGEVAVEDLKCGGSVAVRYVLNGDYVLTWAVSKL